MNHPDFLTTGEAARMAGVCTRTVTMWLDKGLIAAADWFRVPGSTHRRISRRAVVELLDKWGVPRSEK